MHQNNSGRRHKKFVLMVTPREERLSMLTRTSEGRRFFFTMYSLSGLDFILEKPSSYKAPLLTLNRTWQLTHSSFFPVASFGFL